MRSTRKISNCIASLFGPVQDERIDCRNYDQDWYADYEKGSSIQVEQQSEDEGDAYNRPEPTGKAVGFPPVVLAGQCPGNLDAYGVILFAFRQIVADDQ